MRIVHARPGEPVFYRPTAQRFVDCLKIRADYEEPTLNDLILAIRHTDGAAEAPKSTRYAYNRGSRELTGWEFGEFEDITLSERYSI